jgi:acyl-CoA thioesterase
VVAHPFTRATAVTPVGPARWRATLDPDWFGSAAPHGGHLAAQLLRAAQAELDQPDLSARSLSVHFLSAGEPGEFEIEPRVERAGRSLSVVSARAVQRGGALALAVVALGRRRNGPEVVDITPPQVAGPDELRGPSERVHAELPAVFAHYELRFGIGTPNSGQPPRAGGWVRPLEPLAPDDALIAALADVWMPSVFITLPEPILTTTAELTVNFLASPEGLPADGWYLASFWTPVAADGYFREEGEVWSQDGRLLARCSQLGVFLTGRRPPPPYGTARTRRP